MRRLAYCLLALLPAYFIIQGCNKAIDLPGAKGQLVASKTELKINEPDALEMIGAAASDSIKWTVTPSGFDTLLTKNNTAAIVFTKAGTYTVKASVNGATPASVSITVNNDVYTGPKLNNIIPLAGDQITLTPAVYKSANADTTYIYFTAKTANYYCSTNRLNYSKSLVNGTYSLNFVNVTQYTNCTGGTSNLQTGIAFKQTAPALSNGTYPLNVVLNGTTYTGSIAVSATNVIFNWNYTTGVMITPKQVNR